MNSNTMPEAAPCVNPPAALAFLQSFDPDGWHNLVAIHPVTPQVTARTFAPGSWEDLREWIAAHNTSGLNVYFTVNEVRPETGDCKPGKADIARIRAVWIDVDPPKDMPYAEGRWAVEKTLLALSCCPCPPTHLVDSGGGLQAFWRLPDTLPADAEAVAWAEGQGRALKAEFGGDAVQNIDRIMRVPGTVNWPTPAKQARGQPPRLAAVYGAFLYDLMGVKWPPPLHRPEELARWLPPVTAPAHTDNDAEIAAVQAEIDLGVAQNGLPSGFLPRLLDVVKRSPALLSALTGDIKGKDTSSSAHRAVVVARLRAAGPFTPTDYATLVFNLDHCQGDRDAMLEEWWRRQLARDRISGGNPQSGNFPLWEKSRAYADRARRLAGAHRSALAGRSCLRQVPQPRISRLVQHRGLGTDGGQHAACEKTVDVPPRSGWLLSCLSFSSLHTLVCSMVGRFCGEGL